MSEHDNEIFIEHEMKKSYLDYAMSVIVGRAIPDIRDGLKPVHRRILYAMSELKNDWNKPYKKSARIVGETIGRYHPHGDSAIYDALVRMAQSFSLRYPIIDGQGNFGSIDGDPPAAMRYTEVRMQQLSHELIQDIDKDTVQFIPNYDESTMEPSVFPSKIPNLLINGSSGIAVGMATNIPPHNLSEIINALIAFIDKPTLSIEKLMTYIPGPDFPTGGIISGLDGIQSAYETGRGVIQIRGKIHIEKSKKGNQNIIVSEIPYQVNKSKLIEKMSSLVKEKQIEGIQFVRDESDRIGMRIVIALKKDATADTVLTQLYKQTQLETSFGIILLAIVNNRPELMTLKDMLQAFILHRKEIIVRRTQFDLKKANERAHILEGLKIALSHLDKVVKLIRQSKSPQDARHGLISKFSLSHIQAQAILDMRLQRLTELEQDKIIDEYNQLLKLIDKLQEILSNERFVLSIIKDELLEINTIYGDSRRTEIQEKNHEVVQIAENPIDEENVVIVTNSEYIKRIPLSQFKSDAIFQKEYIIDSDNHNFISHLWVASLDHSMLLFTNRGRTFYIKIDLIPEAKQNRRGIAIDQLIAFQDDESIISILPIKTFEPGFYFLMCSRNGMIKKCDMMTYNRSKSGTSTINLASGDELVSVCVTDGTKNVFLGTAMGKAIRFHESDIKASGRSTKGVKGIALDQYDRVVTMAGIDYGQKIIFITENGNGTIISIDEYPLQKKGGKGAASINTDIMNGFLVNAFTINVQDRLIMITDQEKQVFIDMKKFEKKINIENNIHLVKLSNNERIMKVIRLDIAQNLDLS